MKDTQTTTELDELRAQVRRLTKARDVAAANGDREIAGQMIDAAQLLMAEIRQAYQLY